MEAVLLKDFLQYAQPSPIRLISMTEISRIYALYSKVVSGETAVNSSVVSVRTVATYYLSEPNNEGIAKQCLRTRLPTSTREHKLEVSIKE